MDKLNETLSSEDIIIDSLDKRNNASKQVEKKLHINNSILLDIISDQAKAKFIWQCVSVCLGIAILTTGLLCFNMYKTNERLNDKVVNTAKLEVKLSTSTAEAEKLKADLSQTTSELKSSQNELSTYKSQSAQLRQQLDEATDELKNLQNRNAEVVKILNGRLQKLSNQ